MKTKDEQHLEYRIKCAEIDGYKNLHTNKIGWCVEMINEPHEYKHTPDYLDDASIDAVVRKLRESQLQAYWENLERVCKKNCCELLRATPEQKAEAMRRTLQANAEADPQKRSEV